MAPNYNSHEKTRQDMYGARKRGLVDDVLVRNVLYGGSDKWEIHTRIARIMQGDPVFDKSRRLYMSRTERYERALAMTKRLYELKDQHSWSDAETSVAIGLIDEPIPTLLHLLAFEPVFFSQASPDLIARYGALVQSRGILGCYLQTELGHGSNVAGLETTATYIPETKEFEIHSPTLTSSKWWIGSLGKTATHGVLQARLVLPGGKDLGPHLFFVQLRSLDDHRPMRGITIGDIGPKAMAGYAGTDNGYARFDHVRIPREDMLSKFSSVTLAGEYVRPPHAKIGYGSMMYIRAQLISKCGWLTAKAATVSIRYTTVRRQGNPDTEGLEQQVISYSSVHYRLLPILARAYVFVFLGRDLEKIFNETSARLASGDTSTLSDTHVLTSALKALSTRHTVRDLEDARRAMGGHGYSAYAGLGRLYADQLPLVTVEGDNYILDKQVVRPAVRAFKQLGRDSHALPLSAQYLQVFGGSPLIIDATSWQNIHTVALVLQWRATRMVQDLASHSDDDSRFDSNAEQRVASAISEAIVADRVVAMEKGIGLPDKERSAVQSLLLLYLLVTAEAALVDLLSFDLLSPGTEAARCLRMAIGRLCRDVLPEAIRLTDAFGFTDWELDSALGVRDGNVYEALWAKVQTEPLNQTEVTRTYMDHIKPMIDRGHNLAASAHHRSKL
ncbi:acyl-CoA oxidase [Neolentinus lepideus HHB14362 ss-1]|uniref:Acyl-coenzyme A oxidase n=1 Tax=Neolentinus lepideus HHB14362 ss-1 TaxID=1314782 RepID=A0A165PPT5_9AGAM|nr:acyl-CoA oxidase [Neolentinus lepideus HHB14362 ss-1]